MTEIQKLFEQMKNVDNIRQFESDYGRCFLQESAKISTDVLTFSLNHCTMSIYNYYDEDLEDDELYNDSYDEQCEYFEDFGTGISNVSFDCTEEEFYDNIENPNILYQDLPVLKEMYQRFQKYLDMDAVRKYTKSN